VHRDGSALLTHTRTDVGPFAIDEVQVAGELEAAPDPLNKVVAVWARNGTVSGHCSGIDGKATTGEIALMSQPDLPHHARAQDLTVTSVLMDTAVVAGVASGVPSEQALLPIRFSSFQPVDESCSQLWKETVSYVRDSVRADDAIATPLVLGQASRLLAAVTLSTFPNEVTAEPTPYDRTDHKPVLLRRAIEFMDNNVTNDIALGDIASAVHVTPRAVQYMFRRHLETTPLQYLRRLRLHYAHQELRAADRSHATVTAIAAKWGFVHTGRFAVMYRQTYGESPHTTLRS
jgi:AraC-like DNA-binding protein